MRALWQTDGVMASKMEKLCNSGKYRQTKQFLYWRTKTKKINFFKAIPSSIRIFFFKFSKFMQLHPKIAIFSGFQRTYGGGRIATIGFFPSSFSSLADGAMLAKLLGPPTRKIISSRLRNQRAKETSLTARRKDSARNFDVDKFLLSFLLLYLHSTI